MSKPPNSKKAKVMIVEDHPMFRERLAHLINQGDDLEVCGEADNIRDGFDMILNRQTDVAIVDLTLKGSNGLELIKNLAAAGSAVPVLVLSMHDESLYAERALRAGAKGYISKHEASAQIMTALRHVLKGGIFLAPAAATKILGNLAGKSANTKNGMDRLTDRELEVFDLIGRGRSTREISIKLTLGSATVETYRARIKEKLGLQNAIQLQQEATRWLHDTSKAVAALS
ncbi:MAG: response regulator transcription factor [Chthoniobacterales bacterium]